LERPAGESVIGAGPERLADDVAAGAAPRPFQPSPVDPEFVDRSACEDPSAVEISARLVSHRDHQAVIDIIGVVRNVGRAAYRSQAGQEHRQALTLVETRREPTGSWSYRETSTEVRRQWFANLEPGEEVRLVHQIVWNSAPRETRTVAGSIYHPPLPPHRYRLEVEYAAANATDSNPSNDDCGTVNNEAVLEPSEIRDVVF
jgi:hypothetical protein